MTRFLILSISVLMAYGGLCQIPQAFSYQAIVLDSSGDPITDQAIGVEIQILDSTIDGPILYSETHSVMTNKNGVYSLNIGLGISTGGTFANIIWAGDAKFLSVAQDVDGGSNYQFVGANQLLSVPYALVAGQADTHPIIWAHTVSGNPNNILEDYVDDTSINFNFNYQWVQGTPEDVYVEYHHLPANTNLYLWNELGNASLTPYHNYTAVDTIFDGLRVRNNRLVRTDPNVRLVPGEYVIEIVFRTESTVLATIDYPIEIIDEFPNPDNYCLNSDVITSLELISNDCPFLDTYVKTNLDIIRDTDDPELITMQFFEGIDIILEAQVVEDGSFCQYSPLSAFEFIDGNLIIEGDLSGIYQEDDEILFNFNIIFIDNTVQDPDEMFMDCVITYTK